MKKTFAPLFVLSAGTLWGVMGIFVRHFNSLGLGSLEISLLRMATGLLISGLYLFLQHRELLKIRLKDLWCFMGAGIVSQLMMNFTYFSALQHTSLAVAGVLLYTAPIFVMLLSALLFRETVTGKKVFALVLAFLGCALVSGVGTDSRVSLPGLLYGLGAGISYAMYSVFGRYAIRRGYGSWTLTFYSFLFCTLASIFLCDFSLIAPVAAQPAEWLWIFGLGLVSAFAPYVLYSKGLEAMENSRASILASIEPVVAAVVGVVVFKEVLTLPVAAGIALVLTAIVILSVNKKTA